MQGNAKVPPIGRRAYIVEDDPGLRRMITRMLADGGVESEEFESAEQLLSGYSQRPIGCVLLDMRLPGMDGLELLERITNLPPPNLIIMVSGFGDIPSAVRAVQMGAVDFLQKPFRKEELMEVLDKAFEKLSANALSNQVLENLTPREREILIALRNGDANKVVAAKLGLSPRTVEMHRARLFKKLAVSNLPQALQRARDAGLIV